MLHLDGLHSKQKQKVMRCPSWFDIRLVQSFKKILIAGTGKYSSRLRHLLVLLSVMNFALHTSSSGQQVGVTTLCKSLLMALIGRKVHRNWCLVTQQDFGVTSPKGFSRGLKSLFRYSDSPCSVWRRSSNSGKKVQKRRDVGWEFGTVEVRMHLNVPNLFPWLPLHLPPSLIAGPESGGGCIMPGGEPSPPASLRGSWGLKLAASTVLLLHTILLSTGRAGPSTELLF